MTRFRLYFNIFLLLTFSLISKSQDLNRLKKPVLTLTGNSLQIEYGFPEECKGVYRVWIELKDSKGNPVMAHSLSGDFGDKIRPGSNKLISWNLSDDTIVIDDELYVKVLAEKISREYSKRTLLMNSLLLPGLGQSKYYGGQPVWLSGIVAYGCLGGSFLLNRKASDSYNLYLHSDVRSESENLFKKSDKFNKTSKVLGYSAACLWGINLIWTALLPGQVNADRRTGYKKVDFSLLPGSYIDDQYLSLAIAFNF